MYFLKNILEYTLKKDLKTQENLLDKLVHGIMESIVILQIFVIFTLFVFILVLNSSNSFSMSSFINVFIK